MKSVQYECDGISCAVSRWKGLQDLMSARKVVTKVKRNRGSDRGIVLRDSAGTFRRRISRVRAGIHRALHRHAAPMGAHRAFRAAAAGGGTNSGSSGSVGQHRGRTHEKGHAQQRQQQPSLRISPHHLILALGRGDCLSGIGQQTEVQALRESEWANPDSAKTCAVNAWMRAPICQASSGSPALRQVSRRKRSASQFHSVAT